MSTTPRERESLSEEEVLTLGDSTDTEPPDDVFAIRAVKALSLVEDVSIVFCRLDL
jgi:hypothetical protein